MVVEKKKKSVAQNKPIAAKAAGRSKISDTSKAKNKDVNTEQASTGDVKQRKSTLHPNYREITVEMTNGISFKTRSTYGQNVLKLDVDKTTHPAWSQGKGTFINTRADAVSKFNNKFNLDFLKR